MSIIGLATRASSGSRVPDPLLNHQKDSQPQNHKQPRLVASTGFQARRCVVGSIALSSIMVHCDLKETSAVKATQLHTFITARSLALRQL